MHGTDLSTSSSLFNALTDRIIELQSLKHRTTNAEFDDYCKTNRFFRKNLVEELNTITMLTERLTELLERFTKKEG